MTRNHSDKYFEGRMRENLNKGKEYDLTLSWRFGIVECLE
jgi:hypothetical protein